MLTKLLRKSLVLGLCFAAWPFIDNNAVAQSRKKAHSAAPPANNLPAVAISASATEVRLPASCAPGAYPRPDWQPTEAKVNITTLAQDLDNDYISYRYAASAGRLTGNGSSAVWDLAGVEPGVYRASVYASDGKGEENCDWVMVRVRRGECADCGSVKVSGPADILQPGQAANFRAMVNNPAGGAVSYQWTVSSGRIVSGQGTPDITVDTNGLGNQSVTAAVQVNGLGAACANTDSTSFAVAAKPAPTMFDSYSFTNMDDAKARLDAFVVQMQQTPNTQAVLMVAGTCEGEAMKQANRQRDYLVNERGVDASRLQIMDGGCRSNARVELWLVPAGADAPAANPATEACPPCKARRR
jgi:hypothetical protein